MSTDRGRQLRHQLGHPPSRSLDRFNATVAEDIDTNGLFLGNHHYPIAREMEMARDIVARLA
ncbi:MAG: hypothetical protein M5U16_05240 [Hyphomicrobium sp.]|nr:hypothetical protein [Hyphomicrobium sp.]